MKKQPNLDFWVEFTTLALVGGGRKKTKHMPHSFGYNLRKIDLASLSDTKQNMKLHPLQNTTLKSSSMNSSQWLVAVKHILSSLASVTFRVIKVGAVKHHTVDFI